MRALVVGDPHLKLSILSESESFVDQLLDLIQSERYDLVILLGDQTDTYAVIRSEILTLWSKFFMEAGKHSQIIVLVGNHDMSGADGGSHSMEPFRAYPNVTVVDEPKMINGIWFLPFVRDTKQFEVACRVAHKDAVLFCHQSFNGAQFENGFYDPHGADPACVAHLKQVVSGHIHLQQIISNIWYPGTPFQHGFADAGQDKNVYEMTIDQDGYRNVSPRQLSLPFYQVIERETVNDLLLEVKGLNELFTKPGQLSDRNFKLKAKGSPSEIVAFWQDPAVKEFKSKSKRVVDALTSVKPTQTLPGSTGKTQKEKLHEFVKGQKWRSSADRVIDRAEKLLAD